MRFIHRRYRLVRVCCTLVLLCSALLLLIHHLFVYRPSDLAFLELNACPACFGVHLCQLFGTDRVQLAGWQRWTFFNNDLFNVKNIYHGTLDGRRVIFKKLAHQSEWIQFDSSVDSTPMPLSMAALLPCSSPDSKLVSRFQDAFLAFTGLDRSDGERALKTAIRINLEPIVLAGLSRAELPLPTYYGACGRVTVVSDEGSNLVSYLHSPFRVRAHLARELLISMHQLNMADADLVVYYPDINLENFVYNEQERRVKIIDLEYVIVVERQARPLTSEELSGSFCGNVMPDYNIERVCRHLLLPSVNETEESVDFLHNIPDDVDRQWNLREVLMTCARTKSADERLSTYETLINLLEAIAWGERTSMIDERPAVIA